MSRARYSVTKGRNKYAIIKLKTREKIDEMFPNFSHRFSENFVVETVLSFFSVDFRKDHVFLVLVFIFCELWRETFIFPKGKLRNII